MISEDTLNEAKNKLNKVVKEVEKTVDREDLFYTASEYTYSSKNVKTIKTFGRDIYNGEIILKEADEDQTNLLVETILSIKQNHKIQGKTRKKDILKNLCVLFDARERIFDAFESKLFPKKNKDAGFLNFDHSKLKIIS